ncbi:MAG: PqqD family protein [Thermoleophilia bacterium]|nr:PqqD family protein [Thermoleophilia bacterium]
MSAILGEDAMFRQAGDAVSRVIQGETVLLTPEDSSVHVLDEVGSRIWDLCAEPVTVATLAGKIAEEYDVSEAKAALDIHDFLSRLIDMGVVCEDGRAAD